VRKPSTSRRRSGWSGRRNTDVCAGPAIFGSATDIARSMERPLVRQALGQQLRPAAPVPECLVPAGTVRGRFRAANHRAFSAGADTRNGIPPAVTSSVAPGLGLRRCIHKTDGFSLQGRPCPAAQSAAGVRRNGSWQRWMIKGSRAGKREHFLQESAFHLGFAVRNPAAKHEHGSPRLHKPAQGVAA